MSKIQLFLSIVISVLTILHAISSFTIYKSAKRVEHALEKSSVVQLNCNQNYTTENEETEN